MWIPIKCNSFISIIHVLKIISYTYQFRLCVGSLCYAIQKHFNTIHKYSITRLKRLYTNLKNVTNIYYKIFETRFY